MMYGGYEMGLSAQAIAGSGDHHPWDPSDLLRCVRYCERQGITTEQLRQRMSGRSETWDRLLPEWDRVVALLRHEMDTRTDGNAPLTYTEMKIIRSGELRCAACEGTGRGETCLKCKGTGRRSGGRCRADWCARGARPCATCRGRGHVPHPTR